MPKLLWKPSEALVESSELMRYMCSLGRGFASYDELWRWSVEDVEAFWASLWDWFEIDASVPYERVLGRREMPGAEWFPGARLSYVEHMFRGHADDAVALVHASELRPLGETTWGELRMQTAAIRAGLVELGVGRGDRVVAYMPNIPETIAAFFATASIGAIWSSASPDFGARSVVDRFAQIEPKVLLAVDGYRYGGKDFDRMDTVRQLQAEIPSLEHTFVLPYLGGEGNWDELLRPGGALEFAQLPFDQPLWVLYSSGTTGLPKGIVQSHGGIVVEHLKALALQYDLGPGDRFLWFTTTGWMMWNFLVGGLLVGSTVVLYDGSPGHPDLDVLWGAVERHRVGVFGTSAPFLQACQKAGLAPGERHDLSGVRTLGSTGSPLAPEQFAWIAESVGAHVQISSMSGGTDVCTAFIASAPTVPVWLGELSCAALGADIHAVDEKGDDVPLSNDPADVGELVINQPMPSMPVALWADPDGSRLREAYFADFPGRWRHGDWLRATPRGSFVISGRSDSTLNRGGVRMGTADLYAVIEGFDEVVDSLVIDTTALGSTEEGALVCFLVLADGASLVDVEPSLRTALRKELSPRHVPDRFVLVDEVPRTLSGKKCEVPVKRILAGVDPEKAVSRGALKNPEALAPFLEMAGRT
jgi:acetoacetyl-CoA synthetase